MKFLAVFAPHRRVSCAQDFWHLPASISRRYLVITDFYDAREIFDVLARMTETRIYLLTQMVSSRTLSRLTQVRA